MSENIKILLLKLIKFGGDIRPLIKSGYEYPQIVQLIKDEIEEGNAMRQNGLLLITEAGNVLIEKNAIDRNIKGSSMWIEPEIESKVPKIDKNEIYLPNQNELPF